MNPAQIDTDVFIVGPGPDIRRGSAPASDIASVFSIPESAARKIHGRTLDRPQTKGQPPNPHPTTVVKVGRSGAPFFRRINEDTPGLLAVLRRWKHFQNLETRPAEPLCSPIPIIAA